MYVLIHTGFSLCFTAVYFCNFILFGEAKREMHTVDQCVYMCYRVDILHSNKLSPYTGCVIQNTFTVQIPI